MKNSTVTSVLGVDIAKNVFQLHGLDKNGEVSLKKRLSRARFITFMAQLPPCFIGLEACGGAHHWGRYLTSLGHEIKLMSPKLVKAYVNGNKNDAADAKACCEAATRGHVRNVLIKTEEQQAILLLHKTRSRLLKQRVQLSNHIRGNLYEFGIIVAKGEAAFRTRIIELLDNSTLLPQVKSVLIDAYEEYVILSKRVKEYKKKIEQLVKQDKDSRRLLTIPGFGPLSASAFACLVKDQPFTKGRQAAAWIGLTPKEHSSGEKRQLLGISKRGHRYLRSLLVHGARSSVKEAMKKTEPNQREAWIQRLVLERGYNKGVVALANKNARIAWAMLGQQQEYQADFANHYRYAA